MWVIVSYKESYGKLWDFPTSSSFPTLHMSDFHQYFNRHGHKTARGSRSRPYPEAADVWRRSSSARCHDRFEDLCLNDHIVAGKRVSIKKLNNLAGSPFLHGLLVRVSVFSVICFM
jgi:hypothetical protein